MSDTNEPQSYQSSSTVRRALAGIVLAILGYIGLWANSGHEWSWRQFVSVVVASAIPAVLAISGRRNNEQRPLRVFKHKRVDYDQVQQ